MNFPAGTEIGPYRIEGAVGEGGMGTVYRAVDTNVYFSIWSQATYAVPLRAGQTLPTLPAAGIRSAEDMAALPGAKTFPVPGAFIGPGASVYAYAKATAQRNIYRVPVS